MDTKRIIGLVLMMLIIITSCSEESPVGEPPYNTGTFTLNFMMNERNTKATETLAAEEVPGHAEGFSYSTKEELTVNNCFIAIFAKGEDNLWTRRILADDYSIEEDKIGSFKVEGLTLPIKTDLKVVAIANLPFDLVPEYKNKTYAELTEAKIITEIGKSKDYYTFDPSSLIKTGEKDMRFNVNGNLVDSNDREIGEAVIPLTQLAAKIYLNLSVILPTSEGKTIVEEGEYFGKYPAQDVLNAIKKKDINDVNDSSSPIYIIENSDQNSDVKFKVSSSKPEGDFLATAYQCKNADKCPNGFDGKKEFGGKKYAHITGLVFKKITTTYDTFVFNMEKVTINNIETSSYLLPPKGQLNSSTCKPVEITNMGEGIKNVRLLFYTYQKPYYVESLNDQSLSINLTGALAKGNLVKEEIWKPRGGIHAMWNDKSNGWGDGNTTFVYDYIKDDQPSDIVENTTDMKPIGTSDLEFMIKINPNETTEGLLAGNYYEVIGKLVMNKSNLTLEYEVVNEEPIKVEILL
ncbi:hypothetical protein [Parabacteroides sp. TM07-1AC]|uniref:hypothetical protein n=1 Tax=Parabacteroides sp. TM07-1AC TaxID=2292363 RepID=UPI0011C40DF8|nr:hypothetical protein [Parabacteroides sp. TM07-1AC]